MVRVQCRSAVSKAISEALGAPVTVFGSAFCGYCRAVETLLREEVGVPEKDLTVFLLDGEPASSGGVTRKQLMEETGQRTVPYVFVRQPEGERFVGGFTETRDALTSGELEEWLENAGVQLESGMR